MTWDLVVSDYAPELSTVDATVGARKVLEAASQLSQADWGVLYESALANLAAHLAAMGTGKGGAGRSGPVTSESTGRMARSYGAMGMWPTFLPGLQSTRWGIELARLMSISQAGMLVV